MSRAAVTRREHISSDRSTYRQFRQWQIQDDPQKAVHVAYAAGLRCEPADLILPCTTTLARLTDEDERRAYSRQHRPELEGEARALARLEAIEASGWNSRTRASELAASRAEREQAARDHAAAVEATTQALIAQEDAARLARIRSHAEAIQGGR